VEIFGGEVEMQRKHQKSPNAAWWIGGENQGEGFETAGQQMVQYHQVLWCF